MKNVNNWSCFAQLSYSIFKMSFFHAQFIYLYTSNIFALSHSGFYSIIETIVYSKSMNNNSKSNFMKNRLI